jgi:hypothetical protein
VITNSIDNELASFLKKKITNQPIRNQE